MVTDIAPNSPKSVFKFYSLSKNSLDTFFNHFLYLSHPFQFNDLMDTNKYTLDMRNVSKEKYKELKQNAIKDNPYIRDCLEAKKDTIDESTRYTWQDFIWNSFFSFSGIFCVSAKPESRFNELMWSHYAKESGFMIEFDTQKLIDGINNHSNNSIFKKLYFKPIKYKDHPTSIRCCDFSNIQDINLLATYQKHKGWSYENEWRFVVTTHDLLEEASYYCDKEMAKRKLYYPCEAIKNIYIGKKFWTNENYITNDEGNNLERFYSINNTSKDTLSFVKFVEELRNYKVYMSGACDCSEFRHGIDNTETYNPDYYYLTRSFELIKDIKIKDQTIIVKYDGIARTKDEDFK